MNSEPIKVDIQGKIAQIKMDRPEVLNAADRHWVEELDRVLKKLEAADNLRVVIITGQGSSFCTGIDLNALATGKIAIDWFRHWEENLRRIEMLEAITIAKIKGYALGGGLQVALACDLRIASADAQLGLPAVLEALIPGLGTYRLPRFIGLGRAQRMILTGELIPAEKALEIGLVDWVVPDNELDQTTERVTGQMLRGARTAEYFSKHLVTDSFAEEFESFCETYLDFQARTLSSPEHLDAMKKYRESKGL